MRGIYLGIYQNSDALKRFSQNLDLFSPGKRSPPSRTKRPNERNKKYISSNVEMIEDLRRREEKRTSRERIEKHRESVEKASKEWRCDKIEKKKKKKEQKLTLHLAYWQTTLSRIKSEQERISRAGGGITETKVLFSLSQNSPFACGRRIFFFFLVDSPRRDRECVRKNNLPGYSQKNR